LKRAANLRIEDLYECGATIGEGHYSIIKRGKRRTENGVRNDKQSEKKTNNKQSLLSEHLRYNRALKIIDKDRYWDLVMKKKERADSIVREVAVQATLLAEEDENEGFCRLLNFFETENNVVLELELLQGKDLLNYLLKSKGNVDESDAAHIMYDVLKCVVTMQERGIAHRDLKPANILMADMTKHGVVVKLSDFGMADFVGSDNLLRGRCGTPGFVAPEIYEAGVNVGYENHVDMFSAGTILYTLLCGYEPFIADTDEELKTENKRGKVSYPYECWKSGE
jgi:calcium/calmodulin-dependent protein kinase I